MVGTEQGREVRFDFGGVSTRRQELADGRIICNATFARDGILVYRQPDGGIVRELRLPETNKNPDTIISYGASPLTLDHPSVLVSKDNAKDLAVGFSDREVVYDRGFLRGVVMVHDGAAISRIDSGKVQLSPGYYCDVEDKPGVWNGQPYDRIQRRVRNNHIAIVDIGRNGPDVRLHWDAADSVGIPALVQQIGEPEQKVYFDFGIRQDDTSRRHPMTERTITLDAVSYQVPPDLAEKISKLHTDAATATGRAAVAEAKVSGMEEAVEEADEKTKEAEEKADAAIEILQAANETLQKLGYVVNRDGEYVQDGGESAPKSNAAPDAAAGEEQEDGHQQAHIKEGSTAKATMDGIEARVDAWVTAEGLVPGIRKAKFDAALSVQGIKRITVEALKPGLQFDDAEVPGLHRALTEGLGQQSDQSGRHADALEAAVRGSNAAAAAHNRQDSAGRGNNMPEINQSYLEPLALTSQ